MAQENRKKKRNDILLLVGLAILILLCFLVVKFRAQKEAGIVEISTDGQVTATYSLSEDKEDILIASDDNGGTNRIVIHGGSVWVTEASCPDKVCIRQGEINQTGQTIVCLPNKMVVTVK